MRQTYDFFRIALAAGSHVDNRFCNQLGDRIMDGKVVWRHETS